MNKVMMIAGAIALIGVMTGCLTMSPEERREAYAKEYERLAALPPAEVVQSPNKAISDCAKLSCDLFNEVQPLMKAYATAVENRREYTGFMNDVRYYVEEEGMSNKDACKKVHDAVIAADAKLPADQKVWPKIQKGIVAANQLDPKKQLANIALLVARNAEIVKSAKKLSSALQDKDFMGRYAECTAISKQLAQALECLVFLGDQYSRVVELENYAR